MASIKEMVDKLEKVADGECTCTEKQQSGEDSSTCKRCQAATVLNEVGEILERGIQ